MPVGGMGFIPERLFMMMMMMMITTTTTVLCYIYDDILACIPREDRQEYMHASAEPWPPEKTGLGDVTRDDDDMNAPSKLQAKATGRVGGGR